MFYIFKQSKNNYPGHGDPQRSRGVSIDVSNYHDHESMDPKLLSLFQTTVV